jgi:ectoine hydroxylase-related dioxygenase (phytanoyl-CoA dioxygenase family)
LDDASDSEGQSREQIVVGQSTGAIRTRAGAAYASRNLLDVLPITRDVWRRPQLLAILHEVLGPNGGLVRALYFDKPPEKSWSLPWHKDRTIAVRAHVEKSEHFTKPTFKSGVPHVEAPVELLQTMVTARIHLDPMTPDNGAVQVIPASHREAAGNESVADAQPIYLQRGDLFLMRPLLTHSSVGAREGNQLHRRTLHLEFAATSQLVDGYQWHDFLPIDVE